MLRARPILLSLSLTVLLGGCAEAVSSSDAGSDAAIVGPVDSGNGDAGEVDAGQPDAGQPDAGEPDAGNPKFDGGSLSGDLAFPVRATFSASDPGLVQVLYYSEAVDACGGVAPDSSYWAINVGVGLPLDAGLVTPGTYVIDNKSPPSDEGGVAIMYIAVTLDGGWELVSRQGSGTVTFDRLGPSGVAGRFDAVMALADGGTGTLSGTFDAPGCP